MSYKIGSFNILSSTDYGQKDEKGKGITKESRFFVQLIREGEFDILALQEFKPDDESLLRSIVNGLGKDEWDYRRAPEKTTGREYAYIYSKKLKCISGENEPHVYTKYRGHYRTKYDVSEPFLNWRMRREPYVARFIPNPDKRGPKPYCEIRLIDVHLWHGKPYKNPINVNRRKEEFTLITDYIYSKIADPSPAEGVKSVFTIIMGDYNLDCRECNELCIANGNTKIKTVQEEYTTLNKLPSENGKLHSTGFSSSYDHFSYDKEYDDIVREEARTIDTVKSITNGDFTKHLIKISDHVPIIIEIY
jgi:exonuclease III